MLEYYLVNPTENITALVVTSVAVELHRETALRIMKKEPTCEQVGFVTILPDHVELRMAGGEFCGNATMSAAALWSFIRKNNHEPFADIVPGIDTADLQACPGESDGKIVRVRTSGVGNILNVAVKEQPVQENSPNLIEYICSVNMPTPLGIRQMLLNYEGRAYDVTAVDLGGILHLVTEEKFDRKSAEGAVKYWNLQFQADAIGLMQLDGNHLTPLVYVPGADTMFWENSCASGTTAVGAYLSHRDGCNIKCGLIQPGGVLSISADRNGELVLTGHVGILQEAGKDNIMSENIQGSAKGIRFL